MKRQTDNQTRLIDTQIETDRLMDRQTEKLRETEERQKTGRLEMSLRDPEDVQARTPCSTSSDVTEAQSEPEDAETELADGDKTDEETTLKLS